jgi:hypothetical protein
MVVMAACTLMVSMVHGYPLFMEKAMRLVGQPEKTPLALQFVTSGEYNLLQVMLLAWVAGWSWMLLYTRKHTIIPSFLQYIRAALSGLWKMIVTTQAKWVLFIPLSCSIYYAITLPVTYDEAFTYVYFTHISPMASMAFYPSPNNHILFSLATNAFHYLPFIPDLVSMRMPSILLALGSWSVGYYGYARYAGGKVALIYTAMVSMVFMSVYYSYMARGYGMVMFFFILSMYACWRICSREGSRNHWILFVLANILGCYAMPSFLYATVSGGVLLILYAAGQWKSILWSIAWISAVLLFLYMPVFIVNGWDAVFNNRWVQGVPFHIFRSKVDSFWYQSLGEMFGLHTMMILTLLGIGLGFLAYRMQWKLLNAFLIIALTPVLILTYQSVIPYARTFVYFIPVLCLIMVAPFTAWLQKTANGILLAIALTLQIVLGLNFQRLIGSYDGVYHDYHLAAMQMVGDNRSFYFDSELFDTVMAFELETRGYRMKKAANMYPTLARPISADTIHGYDYIIIEKNLDETTLKQPVIETNRLNIYQ